MAGVANLPVWAVAIIALLMGVLFVALFYGMALLVGGLIANIFLSIPGGNTPITGGTSPYAGFQTLFAVVFTVGSLAYIAIVIAAVAIVFFVFYYLLSGGLGGATGGGGRRK